MSQFFPRHPLSEQLTPMRGAHPAALSFRAR